MIFNSRFIELYQKVGRIMVKRRLIGRNYLHGPPYGIQIGGRFTPEEDQTLKDFFDLIKHEICR